MPVYMTTEGLADNAVLVDSAQVQIGSLATVCKSHLELLYQCAIRAREIKHLILLLEMLHWHISTTFSSVNEVRIWFKKKKCQSCEPPFLLLQKQHTTNGSTMK